ncbi:MAG: tRNA (N6-isopentenyl adenosine(37)-C2)-methylthiotransferase MiaB [Bacteroidales bacterium]|nr:tRNA (N6-isopentenyl adenosine(37)-C2)-methylthiotransferase MiaB [Bacteroidales bacterium]
MSKYVYIETYGCQMNVNDSEVVAAILKEIGYEYTETITQANLILINTCSIREHAENRVFQRLHEIKKLRARKSSLLIGVIGCMAERLREQLFSHDVLTDIVAGPDSYRDLPRLVSIAARSKQAINVHLSKTETYDDIMPYRVGNNRISTFVSIMRGCNNFCTYCIVPYTRGRERSRAIDSIAKEVLDAVSMGYKEITLLGQNVNSYSLTQNNTIFRFPDLLSHIARIAPHTRIRFSTSHPKDMDNELLEVVAKHKNICKWIHLPVQSGSSSVLQRMGRTYNREWYMQRVEAIRNIIPEASITSDIISGFCGETENEHQETLSLMKWVRYDLSYMFKYSERPGTIAARDYIDDVPEEVKTRRLNEIIALQNEISAQKNKQDEGKIFEVLVEGISKKSSEEFRGRNSQNKTIIFPKKHAKIGDYVSVHITDSNSATLRGTIINE